METLRRSGTAHSRKDINLKNVRVEWEQMSGQSKLGVAATKTGKELDSLNGDHAYVTAVKNRFYVDNQNGRKQKGLNDFPCR